MLGRFIILLFIFSIYPVTSYAEKQRNYTIGIVPQFEIRHIRKIWTPIFQLIEKKTGYKLTFKGSPTIQDFGKELKAGKFDFAYMNPYQLLVANKLQGYVPLIRDVDRKLQGILVVKKDNPIQSIKELENKKIAFPSPNALGATLLIRADIAKKFNINYEAIYVKTHSSVYLNVLVKQTAAGGGVQKTLNQQKDNIKSALRILYRTPEYSPHPFSAHPRVPKTVRDNIIKTFLQIGETLTGKELLAKIPIKKIGKANINDYIELRKLGLDKFYVQH
ncbi:MAG TPA: phosphate/phosphite/phosphonate ABC transporter substrate-binding protein [Gammaproteobacteria bacterium]|nr:phosphate/phosphite/phosphonate ABC transporter substrate-binding protein [Gammaproteobacteria bacterium]